VPLAPTISRGISDPTRTLPLVVYTSTLPRSVQTVAPLLCGYSVSSFEQTSALNMLDTGMGSYHQRDISYRYLIE
jgi:hypothetical protein